DRPQPVALLGRRLGLPRARVIERAPQCDRGRGKRRAHLRDRWRTRRRTRAKRRAERRMSFEVAAGERIIWEGKPERFRGFIRTIDVFIFLMAIVFGFFVVASISAAGRSDPSGFLVGA